MTEGAITSSSFFFSSTRSGAWVEAAPLLAIAFSRTDLSSAARRCWAGVSASSTASCDVSAGWGGQRTPDLPVLASESSIPVKGEPTT